MNRAIKYSLALLTCLSSTAWSQMYHNPWEVDLSIGMHTSFFGDAPVEPRWEDFRIAPYRLSNSGGYEAVPRGNSGYRIQLGPELKAGFLHEKGWFVGANLRFGSTVVPSGDWIYYGLTNNEYYQGEKVSYRLWQSNLNVGYNLFRERWHDKNNGSLVFFIGAGFTSGIKNRGYHHRSSPTELDTFSVYENFVVDYSGWNWTLGLRYRWFSKPNRGGWGWGIDLCRNDHALIGTSMTRTAYINNGEDLLSTLPLRDREYTLDNQDTDDPSNPDAPMILSRETNEAFEWQFSFMVAYRL